MDEKATAIFNELVQICEQYMYEVPGKGKPWPKTVRGRVFALQRLGVSAHFIAQRTRIPYMTMVCWNSKKNRESFTPLLS